MVSKCQREPSWILLESIEDISIDSENNEVSNPITPSASGSQGNERKTTTLQGGAAAEEGSETLWKSLEEQP